MTHYVQLIRNGEDCGEWPVQSTHKAHRMFNVFKRRASVQTSRDGIPREVRLLQQIEAVTIEPSQPSDAEQADFDRDNVPDRFE